MTSQEQILRQGALPFNLSLSKAQLNAFVWYSQELISWNRQINLTRITEPQEIAVKHFLDSLSAVSALPVLPPNFSMIDVGTGAGFPGLPLKIVLPSIRLTLLESTAKKTAFLRHLVEVLQLTSVTVLTHRAEEAGRRPEHREQYDVAVTRAVSVLPVLAEYTLPLVKVGGTVIAQKGQHPADEVKIAARAINLLGGRVDKIIPIEVPGLEAERHLVVIKKTRPTPQTYPRRSGMPAKKPLT